MPPRLESHATAVRQWLARRADTPIGRLALQWFRRYSEATHNSASAATIYMLLSVGPLLLAATGLFHAVGGNSNILARRLVEHQHLSGETARLVRNTFGSASSNALAASVGAIIGLLLWGVGIGQIYQDFYARAWRIRVRTISDHARFTIWFFVLSALLGLFFVFAGALNRISGLVAIPAWLIVSTAFWLWTPRYLLRGKIGLRPLLPGALLASILTGAATALSQYFLGPSVNSDGEYFGSFGVVLALVAWEFVLTTISLTCAVFSPVWADWRESERRLSEAPGSLPQ